MSFNQANFAGGAIALYMGANILKAKNVTFQENVVHTKLSKGGVLYIYDENINAVFNNCTFVNNSGKGDDSVMYILAGILRIANCKFITSNNKDLLVIPDDVPPSRTILTYNSSVRSGNITLHTSDETFLTEMMRMNLLTSGRFVEVKQKETPYASGKEFSQADVLR